MKEALGKHSLNELLPEGVSVTDMLVTTDEGGGLYDPVYLVGEIALSNGKTLRLECLAGEPPYLVGKDAPTPEDSL